MKLPPSAIDLPLNIAFPVYRRPLLDVVVRGRGVPSADAASALTIEVANAVQFSVEVTGVYASYIHTSFPAEILCGSRTIRLTLHELEGEALPPCTLRPGESVAWAANLSQLRDQLQEKRLTLGPHSRYFDLKSRGDIERWMGQRRPVRTVGNTVAKLSHRRLAVVVRDNQGGLHKAKVRWQPPEDEPLQTQHRSTV